MDNGRLKLDNSDIPSKEVKAYYVKETSYYDQYSATFHTKILALCPIMSSDDGFGDVETKYPLFWVKYDDVAPFLAKQTIMTSDLNNAATMSVDDYFVKNMYQGKIYKTNNMLGKTLAQYCPNDTAMQKEQARPAHSTLLPRHSLHSILSKPRKLLRQTAVQRMPPQARRNLPRATLAAQAHDA